METVFECRATAGLLRSGRVLVLAAHVGAMIAGLHLGKGGLGSWIFLGSLLCWGGVVYLAVRVQLDAAFFELLAQDPVLAPELLDSFLERAGLRKAGAIRTIADRRRGAIGLWRKLALAVAIQLATLGLAGLQIIG